MKNSIRTGIISATFVTMPLSINANLLQNSQKGIKDKVNVSLYENLNKDSSDFVLGKQDIENLDVVAINSDIVVDAVLDYFSNEVKAFNLSQQAKEKLVGLLKSYLSVHPILKIRNGNKIEFVIDNKQAFSKMVNQFVNIIIADMPLLVRKFVIPLFLGGSRTIQQKFEDLDNTVMNMKEKQYSDVVFDYMGGIIKRVAVYENGSMKIGDYFDSVNKYYPNKNSNNIKMKLENLGLKDQDIKNLKYPFK